jgi:uncharacterized protein
MKLIKNTWIVCAMWLATSVSAGLFEDYFRAIEMDLADNLTSLLRRGFDPNTVNDQGQTGLYMALREGAEKAVTVFLATPGLEIDKPNQAGETALMMAALKGRAAWCAQLIDKGASVNRAGWTPLHYAASGPNVEAVRVLLDRSAAIDSRSPNGTTALMMAARYGTEASVQLLLQRGASVALRNDKDLNAQEFAKLAGREKLAATLLPH